MIFFFLAIVVMYITNKKILIYQKIVLRIKKYVGKNRNLHRNAKKKINNR